MSKTLEAASFYGRNTIRLSFSDNTWEEYPIGRGVIEFLVVSISDALANVRAAEAKVDALTQQRVTALEALKDARQFIRNGAEFGYIHMPHEPDAGVHTLPRIEAAIAAMEGKADE